ncbi:unnamed protein product [Calypogeia fissa]
MGNKLQAFVSNSTVVRVYHGDNGELIQFSDPTPAVQLMRQHPNYLLVYSVVKARQVNTPTGRVLQHRVHIRLVRPGDYLHIGQEYFLVHIPDQYRPRFARYFDFSPKSLAATSTRSKFSSPSSSPLYSPTASPLYNCSPTASPLHNNHSTAPARSFWSSTASPLPSPLPNPPKSRLSGTTRGRTRVSAPLSTYTRTPLSGSTRETTRVATPRSKYVPTRMHHGSARDGSSTLRVATPTGAQALSTESPIRAGSSGTSTRDTTKLVDQIRDMQRSSAHPLNRIQSPGRPVAPRRNFSLGSIINGQSNSLQESMNLTKSVPSPGRGISPASMKDPKSGISKQNLQHRDSPSRSIRSAGRVIPPTVTQDCRKSRTLVSEQNLQQNLNSPSISMMRSPARVAPPTTTQSTKGRIMVDQNLQHPHSPRRSMLSPGRMIQPTTSTQHTGHTNSRTTMVEQNLQQQNFHNSPSRSMRSPGRAIQAPNGINQVTTTKGITLNQRLKSSPKGGGGSQYYHVKKSSPRRTSKWGSGKLNLRQRRSSTRSHLKAYRIVDNSGMEEIGSTVPSQPGHEHDGEPTTSTRKSRVATATSSAPVPNPNPGLGEGRHGFKGVSTGQGPRTRSRISRHSSSWAPGLGSISENLVSDSSYDDELVARRYYLLKPPPRSAFLRRRV